MKFIQLPSCVCICGNDAINLGPSLATKLVYDRYRTVRSQANTYVESLFLERPQISINKAAIKSKVAF